MYERGAKEKFYITTPIYYVNDRPHIGHAYTTIVADVLARYARAAKKDVVFLAGTDENSQKTVEAALKAKEEIKSYADRLAAIWNSTWETLGITNTDFIRTTEERHVKTVTEMWRRIWEKGDIYKGTYKGLYCVGCEEFKKESDLIDGLCPDHKTKPEYIEEQNYFFKLSKYQKDLLKFYESNPNFIIPAGRFSEVKKFVSEGLEDISISREGKNWGIPVPNDPTHVVYVWFDALINYISAIGIEEWKKHPADLHVIGKNITRFHAVIWPAMLWSLELPLPKGIIANGFFTIDGVKISKSLGNAVDPIKLGEKYGFDALRYFLLREIPFGEDGDFSYEKFDERYVSDLANGLGNLTARTLTLAEKYWFFVEGGTIDTEVQLKIDSIKKETIEAMEYFKFHNALTSIWELIAFGNTYLQEKKPWEPGATDASRTIFSMVVLLGNVAALIAPFLPNASKKIAESITWDDSGTLRVKKPKILFPRMDGN